MPQNHQKIYWGLTHCHGNNILDINIPLTVSHRPFFADEVWSKLGKSKMLNSKHFENDTLPAGGSLHCSYFPLSESTLICSSFLFRGNVYCYYSEWVACCRGSACILSSLYESFTSDRVYLSGCLTAFNFEELIMHFIWLWKVIYIYIM